MIKKLFISIGGLLLAATSLIGCGAKEPTELAISKQPQSIEIENGSPMSMSVEVNNPKLVRSYQWYYALYQNGEYVYQIPLEGSKALTETYSLPVHYGSSNSVEAYQCEIIDVNGKVFESEWGLVTTKPGKNNMSSYTLGDYPIVPGKTLDLKDTPYGTGTISLNEAADHFVFNNVSFTNEHFDSNSAGLAFDMSVYNPDISNYTFEFIGHNYFSNVYWEDNRYQGGAAMVISALDLDDGKHVTATFTGSGSVSFSGGAYGIITNFIDVVQDIDMSFYSQGDRYTGGIYCEGYTLRSNRTLTASLNKRVIDAKGDIKLESGSNAYINLNVAAAGPRGAVDFIDTIGNVYIKKANVKVNLALNVLKEIEDDIFVSTWCIGGGDQITIEDSNIEYSIREYNTESEIYPDFFVSSGTAGCFSGDHVGIFNSKVNVEILGDFINEARAFNCRTCAIGDSEVNINIEANTAGGICCYAMNQDIETSFECANSNIVMNLRNKMLEKDPTVDLTPFDNGGIFAGSILLLSNDRNVIVINTNGVQTIALKTGVSKTKVTPHSDYTGEFIKFPNATITSTKEFVHNEQSYSSSSGKNVVYECLYEDLGSGNYKFLDNVVITYTKNK